MNALRRFRRLRGSELWLRGMACHVHRVASGNVPACSCVGLQVLVHESKGYYKSVGF